MCERTPCCRQVMDEHPVGVLVRRDEEVEPVRFAVCWFCRRAINEMHNDVEDGYTSFLFVNPNAESAQHLALGAVSAAKLDCRPRSALSQPRKSEWHCHNCAVKVNSRPRVYEGTHEPVDWHWCRRCQAAHAEAQRERDLKQKSAKRAKVATEPKTSKLALAATTCQRLDAWVQRGGGC